MALFNQSLRGDFHIMLGKHLACNHELQHNMVKNTMQIMPTQCKNLIKNSIKKIKGVDLLTILVGQDVLPEDHMD
jgi:hypothetical protein